MKSKLAMIAACCTLFLVFAGTVAAAEMSIREYPDQVVLSVDGSKDPGVAAKTPARASTPKPTPAAVTRPQPTAQAATPRVEPAATPVSAAAAAANPMLSSGGYQARLETHQVNRIADRLKARQDRWKKYLRNKKVQQ